MKKASKMLVLLLVAALVLGTLSGCGLFTKNTEKYRATVAMTVGKEEITIGKLIDTFNTYYNNYASYISQGYISADDVLDMAMQSLYTQYMKLDKYKSTHSADNYPHEGYNYANQQYLNDAEFTYAVKYVKYVMFTALDTVVESYIKTEYELNAEETPDTSRDFKEYDDLRGAATYAEYVLNNSFYNKDMNEYIDKYYGANFTIDAIDINTYVYADEAAAAGRLSALNARLDKDAEKQISFAEYKAWQEKAVNQYCKSIINNYEYDINELIKRQMEDFIVSAIVTKYNYEVYSVIETTNKSKTLQELDDTYKALKDSQIASFAINNNYVTYIESLSDSSYIHAVSEDYNYIFVKNILIPFTSEQTTILSNLEKQLGSSDNEKYIAKRNEFAAQIVAKDFFGEKDEDGKYPDAETLPFALDADKNLIVNPDGIFKGYLNADGTVEGDDDDATIIELMKQYNTDTAQHSTTYDYVVRVGAVPDTYKAKWVSEFVDAANDAVLIALGRMNDIGEGKTYATRQDAVNSITSSDLASLTGGTYALAVSSYGVHIVYYCCNVTAQVLDFSADKYMDTSSAEYRMFKTYYDTQSSTLMEEAVDALKQEYYGDKIVATKQFQKFLKDNKLTEFDFEKSISLSDED